MPTTQPSLIKKRKNNKWVGCCQIDALKTPTTPSRDENELFCLVEPFETLSKKNQHPNCSTYG